MRLIDADKVDFSKVFIGSSDFAKDTREAAQELIDAQATAYDVDEVVEQLLGNNENIRVNPRQSTINLEEAIRIVKAGGVNE